jgi:hypothetical protein
MCQKISFYHDENNQRAKVKKETRNASRKGIFQFSLNDFDLKEIFFVDLKKCLLLSHQKKGCHSSVGRATD